MSVATGCLYCGKVNPWWTCDCVAAEEVRQGKRLRPRARRLGDATVIIVDAEAAVNNALGLRPVNTRPVNNVNNEASVSRLAGNLLTSEGLDVNNETPDVNRASYMRDYMRRKRSEKNASTR